MYQSLVWEHDFFFPPRLIRPTWTAVTKRTMKSSTSQNNPLSGAPLQGGTRSKEKNGSGCPRPKCIPWPENEPAAPVTHDLHRKRPVTLYNDRSPSKSAWAHSMTHHPSLLARKIEMDNKMLYWFPCPTCGCLFKTARLNFDHSDKCLARHRRRCLHLHH